MTVPVTVVDGVVPDIVRLLDAAEVPFADAVAYQSTLDDVFFALTGHAAEDAVGAAPGAPVAETKGGQP